MQVVCNCVVQISTVTSTMTSYKTLNTCHEDILKGNYHISFQINYLRKDSNICIAYHSTPVIYIT